MRDLRGTLVTEGSSDDDMLIPILEWTFKELKGRRIRIRWADLRIPPQVGGELSAKVTEALRREPCDILFVHRDEDGQGFEGRWAEIDVAVESVARTQMHVPVVPVRMSETWLLHDEAAIRAAAGNSRGRVPLGLPKRAKIEQVHAKNVLYAALVTASECRGRELKEFRNALPATRCYLASLIEDWRPLRQLPGYQRMEERIRALELPD
ncbi:MAG: hypothetical protein RL318_1567 [Fibrobacterota bacterium]|jgi:hypothetical protein